MHRPRCSPSVICSHIDQNFGNIILLGLGFMFSIGSYQTASIVQTVVLNSVHDSYFNGTATMGYVCMGINTCVQGIVFIIGPSLVVIIGPKTSLVIGAVCLNLFIACFLRPLEITMYIGSAVLGFGVSVIWVVQGYFITMNSTKENTGRNTGIFWAMCYSSLVWGNLFYFYVMYGQENVGQNTRIMIFATLLVVCILGTIIFCFIKHPWFLKSKKGQAGSKELDYFGDIGFKQELWGTLRLFVARDMLFITPLFCYVGLDTAFRVNVYQTCIGYTKLFPGSSTALLGLSGVCVGCGEIAGGVLLGIVGKWSYKHGRDPAIILIMIIEYACFYTIYLTIPAESPLGETFGTSFFKPNVYLAMTCAFLLGLSDATWNNQVISYLETMHPTETLSCFGIYNFWVSSASSIAFFYSTNLRLPFQLLILVAASLPAAFGFLKMEWESTHKDSRSKSLQRIRQHDVTDNHNAETHAMETALKR